MSMSAKAWRRFAGRAILYIGGCRGSREALSEASARWDPRAQGGFAYHSKDFSRYGGATTSLGLVFFGEKPEDTQWIIIDQGTGVIGMARNFIIPTANTVRSWVGSELQLKIRCFQTHLHKDHVSGLNFNSIFYQKGFDVKFYSPDLRLYKSHQSESDLGHLPSTERMMLESFSEDQFPVILKQLSASISHEQFTVGKKIQLAPDIEICTQALWHPGGCCGYRIIKQGYQPFICMTDCDLGSDPNIEQVIKWMDCGNDQPVIYGDIQYSDEQYHGIEPTGDGLKLSRGRSGENPGWGHNGPQNFFNALKQPAKVIWGHHDPNNDDATLDKFREHIWDQAQEAGFETEDFLEARDAGKIRVPLQKLK